MASSASSNYLVAEAQLIAEKKRAEKAKRLQDIGEPIQLPGKALDLHIEGNHAWIAENTTVLKKLDLEAGKVVQVYKGHTGPVTSLAFYKHGDQRVLISGSWDKSIRLWNTSTKELLSTTVDAHNDFVKTLLVIPGANLLVSGGSDKIVRFWHLSDPSKPLQNAGSISSHTRPVESLAGYVTSPSSVVLYTADTMGIIRVWRLQKEAAKRNEAPLWKAVQKGELTEHRTRIDDLVVGQGVVWSASTDESVQIRAEPSIDDSGPSTSIPASSSNTITPPLKPQALTHPAAVRAILPLALTELGEPYLLSASGDALRIYDVASLDEPELLGSRDVHWHDITAIKLWYRRIKEEEGEGEDLVRTEPWIVTTSLDQTIRKWKLADLINPPPPPPKEEMREEEKKISDSGLTEEEEKELAELLDED